MRVTGAIAQALIPVTILVVFTLLYRTHPWITPDSADYLSLGLHRPPGYAAFLRLLRAMGMNEALRFLPQLQAILLVTALAFFARAVGRALRSASAAIAVLVLPWFLPSVAHAVPQVMSEALFMAVILVAAALCLSPDPHRLGQRLGLGACLGLAVLIRATGWPVALGAMIFALVGVRLRCRDLLPVAAALLAVWTAGTAWHARQAGRLDLTGFGAVSLMGKSALLAQPGDALPAALRELPMAAAEARALIAEAPGYGFRARLRFQAYEDLRWGWIWPRAEAAWPGWRSEDKSSWAPSLGAVARAGILAHPSAYARLVVEDYLALFLWPELALPGGREQEEAFLAGRVRRVVGVHCGPTQTNACWVLFAQSPAPPLWLLVLPLLCLALVASWAVLAWGAAACLARAAPPPPVALLASLLLQGQALSTALVEGGLLRYAAPLMPFAVALAVAACLGAARFLRNGYGRFGSLGHPAPALPAPAMDPEPRDADGPEAKGHAIQGG